MGYLSIPNLYRPEAQQILQFKQVFALEKLHGTSASVSWTRGKLGFFSGGENYERFKALFNEDALTAVFTEKFGLEHDAVIIYGEAYGGKQQGMSATYGTSLKFAAFDVRVGESWLGVELADALVTSLGLEFVAYDKIETTMTAIDACRDMPSTQAVRNGIYTGAIREGVVLRPPFEVTTNNGSRVIAKHKREEFSERGRPKVELDPTKQEQRDLSITFADEWVTAMRLEHVIDKIIAARDDKDIQMQDIPLTIRAMIEDVTRESVGEVDPLLLASKDTQKAIGTKTVKLFKTRLDHAMRGVV